MGGKELEEGVFFHSPGSWHMKAALCGPVQYLEEKVSSVWF